MKKSKLSITLVTSFIAAMAMTACSSVTADKKAVVTFTPYGSKEQVALYTDDVYDLNRDSSSGISKFYDKVLEVLIRYSFKNKNNPFKGELSYSEIENWANNQVKEQKNKASANAKSNGTTYEDELDAILESNGVDDVKELKEKYIYEKEKEVAKNKFADNQASALKEGFIGIKEDGSAVLNGDVPSAMPYHIRHILVKVDQGSSNSKFYKETISETQAKLLSDTVTTLAEGKFSFAEVAKRYSEDTSSSNGGDVGIMTNAAQGGSLGMVSEFQLGIYAYDNIYADRTGNTLAAGIKANLGINDDVTAALPAKAVEVPYEAFVELGEYAKITADKEGNKLADDSSALYPRNIIWNKYFNLHNVFVIKNAHKAKYDKDSLTEETVYKPEKEFSNLVATGEGSVYDANLKGFNATSNLLQDEEGRVIIGVRSQYGIHLMIIQKSIYDANLSNYYDTKITGNEVNHDATDKRYVTYIESNSLEDYKKRADDIKSKITSYDSTFDYKLYEHLKTEYQVKFADEYKDIEENITGYISNLRTSSKNNQAKGLKNVWRSYSELLSAQETNRTAVYTTYNTTTGEISDKLTRLVPEKVADAFYQLYTYKQGDKDLTQAANKDDLKALYDLFAEGGDYYYYA